MIRREFLTTNNKQFLIVFASCMFFLFALAFTMVFKIDNSERKNSKEIEILQEDVKFWKENYQEVQIKLKACEEK